VLVLNFGLTVYTNRVTLQDYPNISDEYVYQLMAQMFAEGRLWVPSPQLPEFFQYLHTFNDGRFYGKYSPGWPAALAVGYTLGIPWLVNGFITSAALFLLHRMATRHFSPEAANLGLITTVANPFIVFLGATYYSHPACLLFLTIFLGAYLDSREGAGKYHLGALMALGAGLAFLTRPYTALVTVAPLVIVRLGQNLRARRLKALSGVHAVGGSVFAVFLGIFLLYNLAMTGDPLLQPFAKYDPNDRPRLDYSAEQWAQTLTNNLFYRLIELNSWVPLSLFFILMYLYFPDTRRQPAGKALLLFLASLFGGYVLYMFHGLILHGPHYVYESVATLILLSGAVLARLPRATPLMLGVVLALNVVSFASSTRYHSRFVEDSKLPYRMIEQAGITDAVIFLRTGTGTMSFRHEYTRNGIHFDGRVLYALDLGPRNAELMALHPNKRAYLWDFDRTTGRGKLVPWPD
jgi:hypothetical protein